MTVTQTKVKMRATKKMNEEWQVEAGVCFVLAGQSNLEL
jgi:hypothetical protein